MVSINAHFDGQAIVPDDPRALALPRGTRLRVQVESLQDGPQKASAAPEFRPLNIHISPELSHAIAMDPEFNDGAPAAQS